MDMNFKDKKILVTGAGRGIGRAVAIALSRQGCKVYALSRTKEHLDSLVKECPTVVPLTVDISNWEETRNVLEKLEALDGLVNNAAILQNAMPALDTPKDLIDKLLDNNMHSAINCIQVVAKKMIEEKKKGSIVNVSTVGSLKPSAGFFAYVLSKAGMDLSTKLFALELGPFNIRVNTIHPTVVMTDMGKNLAKTVPTLEERVVAKLPLERLPEVDEIVRPILYFLSDWSSSVTGTDHLVDCGMTCGFKN